MGKKKFIDKKKAATFQLFARDSSDPNFDGTDQVFVRVDNSPYSIDNFLAENKCYSNSRFDDDPNSIFPDAPDDTEDGEDGSLGNSLHFGGGFFCETSSGPLPEDVRREILELGFPDDGYNYLLHLRDIKSNVNGSGYYQNPKAKLHQLPHDIKAYDASRVKVSELKSEDRNDKSIYNVASKSVGVIVQKVVDPEVAALLDDSDLSRFGSDAEDLEEDFVVRANIPEGGEDLDADVEGSEVVNEVTSGYVRYGGDRENVLGCRGVEKAMNVLVEARGYFRDEKQRVRRPLDEQFDSLEHQEYGTDNEDDEYDGYMAGENKFLADKHKHALNDHVVDDLELNEKYEVPADLLHDNGRPKNKELIDLAADIVRLCREYGKKYENEDEDKEVIIEEESSDESEKWDCETVVSTYSNLDNHPTKIGAPETARKKMLAKAVVGALNASSHVITLGGKEKLPVDFLPYSGKPAMEKVKGVPSLQMEQQKRKQHGQESKEEKKERKAAVKEERREARRVKKEMKGLYQGEAQHAQRAAAVAGPSSIHLVQVLLSLLLLLIGMFPVFKYLMIKDCYDIFICDAM
ncbi:protein LTV1-like [Populus alba x Populus x berolinensis]|nr:protein LTV1-like [Populus alba x Populus x berolinensis]